MIDISIPIGTNRKTYFRCVYVAGALGKERKDGGCHKTMFSTTIRGRVWLRGGTWWGRYAYGAVAVVREMGHRLFGVARGGRDASTALYHTGSWGCWGL